MNKNHLRNGDKPSIQGIMNGAGLERHRRDLVERFNATDNANTLGFCLPGLFENIAKSYPNDIAVISGNIKLTYRALDSRANLLKRTLAKERGVKQGDVVGVALNRSSDLIITILAIMKAGAVYMPIEPALPAERVRQMMDDANPKLIITSHSTLAGLSLPEDMNLSLDAVRAELSDSDPRGLVTTDLRPEDLAYIIYTSGSTGKPKGALANHGALCNLLLAMQQEPGCSRKDRLLAVASVSFDISIADMFLPLVSGATLVIAQTHELRDPGALLELMHYHAITMTQATPSFWQMLLDSGWQAKPRVSRIVAAGEPLSRRLADRLLDRADELWNAYGPSEATIYACMGRVRPQDEEITIGAPVPNFQLHVLQAEDMSPVSLDSIGELYIGGVGVNCGYHNRPELTRISFLDNPFDQGRLYRTGDLARFTADGKLILVGRADSQVKVRGYRIELGDISAAITAHKDVSAAIVVNHDDQLIAYYLRNYDHIRDEINGESSFDNILRSWLAQLLPMYMMPAFFTRVDAFPMTVNGKIDKKALPDPIATIETRATRAKPRTALESSIFAIWSHVLGHNNIGINDNFFHIGGTSLRVPHVKTELDKLLRQPVPATKLFEHYTIKTLANYLERGESYSETTTNGTFPTIDDHDKQPKALAHNHDDIAVISMACRLPNGITKPEEYWEILEQGHHGIMDVPKDRWNADALFDADPQTPGKSYCKRGGFIAGGIDSFDAPFFGISPTEARTLDATQYIVLETCWEGFESAGYTMPQLRGSQTGVFIGQSNISAHNDARHLTDLDGYALTGSSGATLSGRVSYILGLEGPSLTVDTACSSSLVSTHLACTALRQGECDMAIAGGITLLSPGLFIEFSRLRGLSPDGHCRAFSADTQGTGLSEGSTAVLLKRVSDAQRDGDTIHAVLRGSAVNHGGRRNANLTIPSSSAQERLIRTALGISGLRPSEIDYIEAHGTATKLGDPIEGTALIEVFGNRPSARGTLWVGSSKSNLGHTQGAAGLAGVIKVALAMQHQKIPRTLHVNEPTPMIDWQKANMALVLKDQPWIPDNESPRRAGVSSFGIGGTNAHVIVEEAPLPVSRTTKSHLQLPPLLSFLVSAQSDRALRQQLANLHQHIRDDTFDDENAALGDLAYSLATTRTHFRRRVALLAASETDLEQKLATCSGASPNESFLPAGVIYNGSNGSDEEPHLAMLFTGQGSQRLGMGKQLCQVYPFFRVALEDIASHFPNLQMPLLDVIWADPQSEAAALLQRTDFAQPAIFALEVALWRLWQSWGVQPHILLGHSVGELAVAHVAGILDLADACRLVEARGRLMQSLTSEGNGGMAALETNAAEATVAISALGLHSKVDIAGYNTPTQTVISGDIDAVELVMAHVARELACKTTKLNVSHAFHSHHMDEMMPAFQATAETIQFNTPKLPVVSSLTGRLAERGQLERPDYWVQQARRAVRFSDSIQTLYHQQGVNVCLELGPQPVLSGMVASCLATEQREGNQLPALLPSLVTGKREDQWVVQNTLANLHVRHVPIDWSEYFKPFNCRRVRLPTYAFQRQRYSRISPSPIVIPGSGEFAAKTGRDRHSNENSLDDSGTDHFQFEIHWSRMEKGDLNPRGGSSSWGFLCPAGDVSWAQEARNALSRSGIQLTQVRQLQDAASLDGVLCFWDENYHTEIPHGALDLTAKALSQLQEAATVDFARPIVWITRQAVGVRSTDRREKTLSSNQLKYNVNQDNHQGLAAAPLWGLMRTARYEHSELNLRLIDLSIEEEGFDVLAPVLMTGADEPECAIRGSQLLRPQIQQLNVPIGTVNKQQLSLRKDGAVLITGGLGGIGQQLAKWLASTHHIHDLVLTSRRGIKASGAEALIGELAQLGAKATVVACDVGDFKSVKALMETFGTNRPLRGVIHAAGQTDNGVLSTLTPERCATTFKPKVHGAWHLHELTQNMDLDIFMFFSSISGVLGMPGLGNYAAANTFLDALAHLRSARGLPATSIAYGVWGGEGMAANLNGRTTRTHLAHFGLDPLKPEDGIVLFEQAVTSNRALTVAAALDPIRLRNHLEEERGGIPSFFRLLLSQKKLDKSSSDKTRHDRGQLRNALSEAPPNQHAGIVLTMVRETVGKALGYASLEEVDADASLQDIGFDSLTAVLLRNHLANLTQLKHLPISSVTWNHPNLKSLSQYLLSQLRKEAEENGTMSDAAAVAGKAPNSVASINGVSSRPNMSMAKKGCLDPSLTFNDTNALQRPNSVFVTGATGFVGAFILHELLEQNVSTYCLVRAQGIDHGTQRLVAALTSYDLWKPQYVPLLHPVAGNIAEPFFGLSEPTFDHLAGQVDAVCHAGALVDWMRPLDEYIGPNVISTHEVLRLASRGRPKAVHVVSTLATLPKHLGYEVSEHDREYGYSTSKYMGERMVSAARWRGAKASVYRVPFVTASASSGHFRGDSGDFLHNLVAGSIEMGSFPSLNADLSVVLPVDYISKTIVSAMLHDLSRIGFDYDYVRSPAPSSDRFFELMGTAVAAEGGDDREYGIQSFAPWQREALAYATAHPKSSLARIAAVIDGLTEETAPDLLTGLPPGHHVFGGEVYPAPELDEKVARRYWLRIENARLAV